MTHFRELRVESISFLCLPQEHTTYLEQPKPRLSTLDSLSDAGRLPGWCEVPYGEGEEEREGECGREYEGKRDGKRERDRVQEERKLTSERE